MIEQFQDFVDDLVRDDVSRVTLAQKTRALGTAVIQYSKDRPREIVADVAAIAPQSAPLPQDCTMLMDIEYPIGHIPPRMVSRDLWSIYRAPDGLNIALAFSVPNGAPMRLTYRARHVLDADSDTVPPDDVEAVACYAAAILFDQIAAATSGDSSPTIAADAVDHKQKPSEFSRRATTLRQRYHDLLGIDPKRLKGGSALAQVRLPSSRGGRRLIHRDGRG